MRASASDIYGVLGSILVEQKKGQHPLKFSIDRETLHCLSTNSLTVDSLPLPKPAHSKKPRRSKTAVPSDGEQFDFSPTSNISGNVTPGLPTTPHIVPNSKLLIYIENVSSQNPQLICHCLNHLNISLPLFNLLAQNPSKSNPLQVPSRTHHLIQKQTVSRMQDYCCPELKLRSARIG